MDLREIIGASKSGIRIGPWHTGKVPRADFPLARKAYSLGRSVDWCVVTGRALEVEFRVLVIFNRGKQKYDAILAYGFCAAISIMPVSRGGIVMPRATTSAESRRASSEAHGSGAYRRPIGLTGDSISG